MTVPVVLLTVVQEARPMTVQAALAMLALAVRNTADLEARLTLVQEGSDTTVRVVRPIMVQADPLIQAPVALAMMGQEDLATPAQEAQVLIVQVCAAKNQNSN